MHPTPQNNRDAADEHQKPFDQRRQHQKLHERDREHCPLIQSIQHGTAVLTPHSFTIIAEDGRELLGCHGQRICSACCSIAYTVYQ